MIVVDKPPTNGDYRQGDMHMTYNAAQEAIASTVQDGGGTFYADTLMPAYVKAGYAVAEPHGAVLDSRFVNSAHLKVTAKRVAEENNATLVGTWLDGNTLYVDAVRIYADRDEAIRAGIANQQRAIFDFVANRTVSL